MCILAGDSMFDCINITFREKDIAKIKDVISALLTDY